VILDFPRSAAVGYNASSLSLSSPVGVVMWKSRFSLWISGPTFLVSLLLLALCTIAGIYLYQQQQTTADDFGDDVSSAQVAQDLKSTLHDLVALIRDGREHSGVDVLHQRIHLQLKQARDLADKDKERELVGQLENAMARYFQLWESRSAISPEFRAEAREERLRILEEKALPQCRELQTFNVQQIRNSERAHRATVHWVVVGLLSIGVLGALAGLLLGYGVARHLRHSIYHLSVRVQDAASKLGQDLPAVALQEDGDLHQIHEQMKTVVADIEQVVQKLQQREREVLRAEQLAALGQLAAGVAHEIRNPLTSIKMLVQTLREDLETRGAAEDLQIIEIEIRRMERCLQTFLDYARPPKPDFRPLDLAQPIGRTLALVGGRARKQHVTIDYTPPANPIVVTADSEQIQQLFVNLTLNALDAMPRGGGLAISYRRLTGDVEVSVCDTGPGIALQVLPVLFKPFTSTKETGLGLGLVTSRRIAEAHGGSLVAQNRPDGGACFTLRLPLLVEAPVAIRN
jgi:two-component system sensor histidine kinase HydH